MYQYQFSNKQNLKFQNKSKICFKRVWWRKNPSELFSITSIKGRSGSLGSGKGMGAELAGRSFPWEIGQKSNAGKRQSPSCEDSAEGAQKGAVQGGCAGAPRPWRSGGRWLLLGQGPAVLTTASDPVPAVHPATSGHPSNSAQLWGEGRSTAGRAEKVSIAGLQWCAPKLPSLSCFAVASPQLAALLIHPAAHHFLGLFRDGGKNFMGGIEMLRYLPKAWVNVSLAVQKSWQSHCQV